MALLNVEHLCVGIKNRFGIKEMLTDNNLSLNAGEIFGLVGPSGAGKTLFAKTITGLLSAPLTMISGRIQFVQTDFTEKDGNTAWRDVRGRDIFMIFQSAAMALNPTMKIGEQVAEVISGEKNAARCNAISFLSSVGLNAGHAGYYPHQISGGMRQRVQIAIALALSPKVLIADEPTTGLDPINRDHVLSLLRQLVTDREMALILISHDLQAISGIATRIGTLKNGRLQ